METTMRRLTVTGFVLLGLLLPAAPVESQTPRRAAPQLTPVAETKLLMEGMAEANLRGLEGLLTKPPADAEAWRFARGQALLLAETGNLLLIRPPRSAGQDVWMDRATDLRDTAARLARAVAGQDLARSRTGLLEVAAACNRCHQTFRVPHRARPFADPPPARPAALDAARTGP
jgi:hypothetical protein